MSNAAPRPSRAADRGPADLKWIGRQLARSYDRVAEQPLPGRVAELLRRLEARERGSAA